MGVYKTPVTQNVIFFIKLIKKKKKLKLIELLDPVMLVSNDLLVQ